MKYPQKHKVRKFASKEAFERNGFKCPDYHDYGGDPVAYCITVKKWKTGWTRVWRYVIRCSDITIKYGIGIDLLSAFPNGFSTDSWPTRR